MINVTAEWFHCRTCWPLKVGTLMQRLTMKGRGLQDAEYVQPAAACLEVATVTHLTASLESDKTPSYCWHAQ